MKQFVILVAALALACGGHAVDEVDDEPWTDPVCQDAGPDDSDNPGELRIDGCPGDHLGNFVPSGEKSLAVSEFHGKGADGFPCYSDRGTNGLCSFPKSKTWKIVPHYNSFEYPDCGADQLGISFDALWNILNGFETGIDTTNGLTGTGFSIKRSNPSTNTITLSCLPPSSSDTAATTNSSPVTFSNNSLPVGPYSGNDETFARVYFHSTIKINVRRVYQRVLDTCGYANVDQLYSLAYQVGLHERGHALGFDHFQDWGQTMYPFVQYDFCGHSAPDPGGVWATALWRYNPSAPGATTVQYDGLDVHNP